MSVDRLVMRAADRQAMIEHVRAEWPNEACGLLGGPPGLVERVYCVENILHSPVEYQMDPAEQVRIMLEIEAAGWEVCGIFHSHPGGPPRPSVTDVGRAYYPEAVYVILSPNEVAPEAEGWAMRGYEIDSGRVREIPVEVVE